MLTSTEKNTLQTLLEERFYNSTEKSEAWECINISRKLELKSTFIEKLERNYELGTYLL